ncbi:NAD(P)-binding protein [Paxillus ammoniavirescens]|nr:NAD(P)-binding protein [Paxillus ammoniavirescens]
MSSTGINILFTGPTGYIGGSVLSALLRHPRLAEFHTKALVRSTEKASRFTGVPVEPVIGSYADTDLLTKLASESDVVIACADSDDLPAAKAILAGLNKRQRETLTTPVLIHTSGIGVLIDDAQGNHGSNEIYSDLNIHKLESLPRTQPHREVDLAIANAGEEGYAKTCIILPGLVYGIAKTHLVSLGVQNPHSQQIPGIIKAGLDRRQGGVIGKGLNIWSHVRIEDLACLYMHIFDAAIGGCRLYTGRLGFYFGENGECTVGEICRVVAKELHARGCGDSKPTVFTQSEVEKYFTPMMGANARARGERARSIGWRPTHSTRDMLDSVGDEVEASLGTARVGQNI